ncbi:phage protein NinX family protein [Yersinia sp. 1252 StPb PI]|uniref:phage protein NinX family protein n=1 Tax=unclassified Yersinia (in: enterobacteria) TaxID=2653513 RepID=UPI003B27FC4B
MKDYSAMSDFEINKAVAIHLGMKPFHEETGWQGLTKEPYVDVVVRGAGRLGAFNPCNNPADAYPIMLCHGIGIDYDGISWTASDWRENKHSDWRNHPEHPLRLAMIVFLMMNDMENIHA